MGMGHPMFKTSPVEPRHFTDLIWCLRGFLLMNSAAQQYYMDVHIAYRRRALNAIVISESFWLHGRQATCC